MPVKKDSAPKYAVGDKVIMDLDGVDTPATVKKIKSGGNVIVEDDEATEYECEPHEIKPAKAKKPKVDDGDGDGEPEPPRKPAKKAADDDDDGDGDDKPSKKKVGGGGWASTPAVKNKGNIGLPVGNWEALAYNGAAEIKGKKGVQAYIEYVGVHDAEVNGKSQRQYFTLFDEKGEPTEGIGIFKGVLETLGFSEDAINSVDEDDLVEDLNRLLKKLRKMEPWVSIRVKADKNPEYGNKLYCNGLMEDQDDKPENPLAGQSY